MRVKRVQINNFRNLLEVDASLAPGFNYLYGHNGAGKTAVLEALALVARGRSFRTAKTDTLVRNGEKDFLVRLEVEDERGIQHQLAVRRHLEGKRTELRLDQSRNTKTSDLARFLPVQVLLPDASELIYGGPRLRRAYLDWGLFHVEQTYLAVSRRYGQILKQRNAWLKTTDAEQATSIEEDPWFAQLVAAAAELSSMRASYIDRIGEAFAATCAALAPSLSLSLAYEWGGLISASEVEKKLSESLSRDVKLGTTHRGPHRADMAIMAEGNPAAEMLSRGQAKVVASALLLAQAEHQFEANGTRSVILIDDFGAELDQEHWRLFLDRLNQIDCQVIATSTDVLEKRGLEKSLEVWGGTLACELFHVKQGRLTNESAE